MPKITELISGLVQKAERVFLVKVEEPLAVLGSHLAGRHDPDLLLQGARRIKASHPLANRRLRFVEHDGDILLLMTKELDGVQGMVFYLDGRMATGGLLNFVHY